LSVGVHFEIAFEHFGCGMKNINGNTLKVMAYRVLSHDLMIGRYKPGEALSLRPLAASLGTSPMPVREAISRLIAERALVLLPNRTVIVPTMTRARFTELFRVRQLLEGEAGELACAKMTPHILKKLVRINSAVKEHLSKDHIRRALSYNLDFHLTMYKASRADVLLPLIEMLWRQAGPFIALAPRLPDVRWTARFHDEILAGLGEGSPRKVKRSVQHDIEDTMQELLKNALFEND
jgi:DNA-binding GntR family transcriptional regulator